MNEREEILKHLIACNMFAPSMPALAKELGYTGRSGFYRLMKGEAKEHTVNEIWRKIKECYSLTDKELEDIYRTAIIGRPLWEMAKEMADNATDKSEHWGVDFLYLMLDEDYDDFPYSFSYEVEPYLKDLKKKEPNIYYGILVYVIIRYLDVDLFAKNVEMGLKEFLIRLDEIMEVHNPKNRAAKEVLHNLTQEHVLQSSSGNLWRYLNYGIILMRHYADPNYTDELMRERLRLFGWGDLSCWIEAGTVYGEGSRLWIFKEVTSSSPLNGYCVVLKLLAGKTHDAFTLAERYTFHFWKADEEGGAVLQIRDLKTGEMTYGCYDYDKEGRTLSIAFDDDEEFPLTLNRFGLPEAFYQVDLDVPEGKEEKIWARIINQLDGEQYQDFINQALGAYGRFEVRKDWVVKNVTIDREHLSLLIEEPTGVFSYRIDIGAYPFLATVTPFHEVLILYRKDGNCLCAEWNKMGMSIPLSEFERNPG